MRVTFDTNTVDRVVRPARFPKDPRQPEYLKLHQAIVSSVIEPYFSETIITIEGVQRIDRAAVANSTRLESTRAEPYQTDDGTLVVPVTFLVQHPLRQPLHPEVVARVNAALQLGFKALGAPRTGMVRIEDPDRKIYPQESEADLETRIHRYDDALRAIEQRGLGVATAKRLGNEYANRDGVNEVWFHSLKRAKDIHEERAVERAFAEWSDADSIAAHIGYGIDFFCTEDSGSSAGAPSIFDATNRAWLSTTYGVKFVTLSELLLMV